MTRYVREEFNRVAALQNDKRKGNVGFALTILQRRLASSPAAIHASLRRRRQRLQGTLSELQESLNSSSVQRMLDTAGSVYDEEDIEDIEDATAKEVEQAEGAVLDRATAASTIDELRAETETLLRLERLARDVLRNGGDKKWQELEKLLTGQFPPDEKTSDFSLSTWIRSIT